MVVLVVVVNWGTVAKAVSNAADEKAWSPPVALEFGENTAVSANESKGAFSVTESFFKEEGEAKDEGKAVVNAAVSNGELLEDAAALTSEVEEVDAGGCCCCFWRRREDGNEFKDRLLPPELLLIACPLPVVVSSAVRGLFFAVVLEFREFDSALLLLEMCSSKSETLLLTPLSDAWIVSLLASRAEAAEVESPL